MELALWCTAFRKGKQNILTDTEFWNLKIPDRGTTLGAAGNKLKQLCAVVLLQFCSGADFVISLQGMGYLQ